MEDALIWLINQFGEEKILSTQTLTPTKDFFPTHFDGTDSHAISILSIVAQQMDVNPNGIKVEFYSEGTSPSQQLYETSILLQQFEEDQYSAGQYLGKNNNGDFLIAIERGQLSEPDKLIATMAHEIAHIKILGENRLQENDEYLTDLTTVFFGLEYLQPTAQVSLTLIYRVGNIADKVIYPNKSGDTHWHFMHT